MSAEVKNLLGTASSVTLTKSSPASPSVTLSGGLTQAYLLYYDFTVSTTDGADSVYLILQTSFDSGVTWIDAAAGNAYTLASAQRYGLISAGPPGAAVYAAVTDGTLSAGTVRLGLLGHRARIKAAFTDADDDATATLSAARLLRFW